MNAPFPRRVLRSYQEKATTYLLIAYEFIEVPALGAREEWNARTLLAFHPASAGHGLNLQHGGSRIAVCVVAETVDEMKRDRLIGKISAQEAFRRHLEQV